MHNGDNQTQQLLITVESQLQPFACQPETSELNCRSSRLCPTAEGYIDFSSQTREARRGTGSARSVLSSPMNRSGCPTELALFWPRGRWHIPVVPVQIPQFIKL